MINKRFQVKITPIASISHIQLLCALLEALIIPTNVQPDSPMEVYETFFVFACIWAYGSALFYDGQTDYRSEFTKFFLAQYTSLKLPGAPHCVSVFDYWVDPSTGDWAPWSNLIPTFEMDSDLPLQACLVHNTETIRMKYFVDMLVKQGFPTMLIGLAGTGKTLLFNEKLLHMGEDYSIANIPFNFYYNSEMTQKILEKPLEKKAGKNYGPVGNKKLVYFLDDMNMPEVDQYGTAGPHTLIR